MAIASVIFQFKVHCLHVDGTQGGLLREHTILKLTRGSKMVLSNLELILWSRVCHDCAGYFTIENAWFEWPIFFSLNCHSSSFWLFPDSFCLQDTWPIQVKNQAESTAWLSVAAEPSCRIHWFPRCNHEVSAPSAEAILQGVCVLPDSRECKPFPGIASCSNVHAEACENKIRAL